MKKSIALQLTLVLCLTAATAARAGLESWSAGGADTNWSTAGNWTGTGSAPPAATDNVSFNNAGAVVTTTATSSAVDSLFGGTIASLQYSNNINFQNTLISSGVTLSITGTNGIGDTLAVSTENISSPSALVTNMISGPGAKLVVSNTAGNFMVSQSAAATGARAVLIMTNLDTFQANVSRIGIGVSGKYGWFANNSQTFPNGVLYLARTNFISTSYQGGAGSVAPPALLNYTTWASNYVAGREIEEAIEVGNGADNSASSSSSYLFLGQTNVFQIDSIGVGKSKSSSAGCSMLFNPAFSNPVAYFRGTNGGSSRVSFWAIGDNVTGGSTSSGAFGTNDFNLGTVDLMVDQMMMGIDKNAQTSSGTPARGQLMFTNGTVDVNILTLGAQESSTTANLGPALGYVFLNGSGATLKVNNFLELGHTTIPANSALLSFGSLAATNGTVLANNVIVGANSISNVISLNNATMNVTNTLATNATGLFTFTMVNATLGLNVPANASVVGLVKTLNTFGATNRIQLLSVPVFSAYPTQFTLVKYTTWATASNLGLTNVPASAPGATLVSNNANSSIDLLLPSDPRPVITSQPASFSGTPGTNVTLSVTIAAASVTPLTYQWFYVNGGVTNQLVDGSGPSGSSTLIGSTNASLVVSNAQSGDSGNYYAVITNTFGSATSSQATVTITASDVPPSITGPSAQTTTNGITTTIVNSVSGSPTPTIKWQFNGVDLTNGPGPSGNSTISGVTSSTLTIVNPQHLGDEGTYSLIASNITNSVPVSVTNATALTILVPPSISVQPTNLTVVAGSSASFSVTASGIPAVSYQWKKNGGSITSATNSTFTISSAQATDIATYAVVVQNTAGSASSANATLTVNSTMTASFSPTNGATGVCYDTPLSLTFSQAPTLRTNGMIKIFNIASPGTPVDTIDLSQGSPQSRTIGGVAINTYPVIINGNTAVVYPHSGVMTSNKTYYVTVDDGAFADSTGAYFAGVTDTNAWQFATKLAGPVNSASLIVAADGTGDFCTVQGAIDAVPNGNTAHVTINIHNGTYTEVTRLNSKNNVTFLGQDRHQTIITYANFNGINGSSSTRPMFGVLGANDVSIENLTLTNSTPNGTGNNQAEALFVNVCKRFIAVNVDLESYQDTMLINANGDQAYVQNSHVQGNTDYIWGQGTIYTTNAELMYMAAQSGNDYLTQARTPQNSNGFAFVNCLIDRVGNSVSNCFLGRDASGSGFPFGQVAYINCQMDTNAVVPAGWALGSGTTVGGGGTGTSTLRLWEYQSVDLSSNPVNTNSRASWSTQITGSQAASVQDVTNWFGGWLPQLAPVIVTNPVAQSTSAGGSVSFNVGAIGVPSPAYQWIKDGTNLPGATSATLSIPTAHRADGGNYGVIVSNNSGAVTSSIVALTYTGNASPVANTANFTRGNGLGLKILISDLLTNATDADGDPIVLTGVASTTDGVTLTTNSTFVFYTATNDAPDTFSYSVADAFGGSNTGTVSVTSVGSIGTQNTTIIVTSNSANVGFFGIPGDSYHVQRSTNLTDWTTLDPVTADSFGVISYSDTNTTGLSTAFYRLISP